MSYTPTEWKTGDIVSSQRLNKLEEGVKDAYEVMVINGTVSISDRTNVVTDATMEKTAEEIYNAAEAGMLLVFAYTTDVTTKNMAIIDSVSKNADDDSYSVNVKALDIALYAANGSENPTYSGT